jgi:very-short-patch-repair endonuclease
MQWAERRYGLIRADVASRIGFSRQQIDHRLQRGRWQRVRDEVYRVSGTPRCWEQEILAATWTSRRDALASFASSLRIWNLGRDDQLEVTTFRDHQLKLPGVRCHRSLALPDTDRTRRRGIPVTSVARTIVDVSGRMSAEQLGELIDEALRARILKLPDLARCVAQLRPARGRRLSVVRACLDLRIPGYDPGDSTLETRAVRALIHRGLPAPRQQHPVRLEGKKYLLDLAYPDHMVAIEADSWEFHGPFRSAFEYDRRRRNALVAHGWSVLQFTARMSDDEMADRAERALELARARAGDEITTCS